MGGHGHGHGIKIPSPDYYKVENCPLLVKYQERLAKEGLKDPWIRNEVWRFHPGLETKTRRAWSLLRAWQFGIPAFFILFGIQKFLEMGKEDHHGESGHH